MQVVVARIGKAHGLRGEVTVQVLTGAPDERFVPGATFVTEPEASGPLVLRSARDNNGILLLGFEQTEDRSSAEALRGTLIGFPFGTIPAGGKLERSYTLKFSYE